MKRPALLLSALILAACGASDDAETPSLSELPSPQGALVANDAQETDVAMLTRSYAVINASGSEIGTVTIMDEPGYGVTLELDVTSIPEGSHAIHFHETGRCDTPDFTSSGGHYNPSGHNHGFEASAPNPHAGDMPNFDAPLSGVVNVAIKNERVTLADRDDLAPLFDADNTALIIHAGADDYMSQPSGAAGARIACAVIAP